MLRCQILWTATFRMHAYAWIVLLQLVSLHMDDMDNIAFYGCNHQPYLALSKTLWVPCLMPILDFLLLIWYLGTQPEANWLVHMTLGVLCAWLATQSLCHWGHVPPHVSFLLIAYFEMNSFWKAMFELCCHVLRLVVWPFRILFICTCCLRDCFVLLHPTINSSEVKGLLLCEELYWTVF